MDIVKIEKTMSGCLWVFMIGMPGAIAVVMFVMAIVSFEEKDVLVMCLVSGLVFTAMAVLMGPGMGLLMSRSKRRKEVLDLLDGLHERWRGTITLPTVKHPIAAPRIESEIEGLPFQFFLQKAQHTGGSYALSKVFEGPHAQLGAQAVGFSFRANMWLEQPAPVRLIVMTRTRIAGLGRTLANIQEVSLGPPDLDEAFAIFSDQPQLARSVLSDHETWAAVHEILVCNPPFLSRLEWSPRRAIWLTVGSSNLTPDVIDRALKVLHEVASKLEAAEVRTETG